MWVAIAAGVAGVFGLLSAVVSVKGNKLTSVTRFENAVQHAESQRVITDLVEVVKKVDSKLDRHVEWHLYQKDPNIP